MEKTYIIGVSGGPDSMALLDMCVKKGIRLIVAHMNYQKRITAQRDEDIVIDYCKNNQIVCEVRKASKVSKGNFQAEARKQRYQFYQQLIVKYNGEAVLLAHHMDDHIETYLMQQKRGSTPSYYGINSSNEIMGCKIIRPLLHMQKKALVDYCDNNNIPYGIDESNLSDDYTRNQIRHEIVEKMSYEDKIAMINEIAKLNEKNEERKQKIQVMLQEWKHDIQYIEEIDKNDAIDLLQAWIYKVTYKHISIKMLEEIYQGIYKHGYHIAINEGYNLESAYGILYIYKQNDISYHYELHELELIKTPYFCLCNHGKVIEGVNIKPDDFPIVIRNGRKDDVISLRYGKKKLNRFFIDRKIPMHRRFSWPVIENKDHVVIFIMGIGCDIEHFSNNPNLFMVEYRLT